VSVHTISNAYGAGVFEAEGAEDTDGVELGVLVGVWLGALVCVFEGDALAVFVVLDVGVADRDGVTDGVGVGVAVVVGNADGAGAAAEHPCRKVDSTIMCTFDVATAELAEEPTFVIVTLMCGGLCATTLASQTKNLFAAVEVHVF